MHQLVVDCSLWTEQRLATLTQRREFVAVEDRGRGRFFMILANSTFRSTACLLFCASSIQIALIRVA